MRPSGSAPYTLPLDGWGRNLDFPPDRSLVLGENGTAFATVNGKFVSFNIASGSVNWTWQANYTGADMIAATAGNGLVVRDGNQVARLDSSGAGGNGPHHPRQLMRRRASGFCAITGSRRGGRGERRGDARRAWSRSRAGGWKSCGQFLSGG
jgi:hypothetical protein